MTSPEQRTEVLARPTHPSVLAARERLRQPSQPGQPGQQSQPNRPTPDRPAGAPRPPADGHRRDVDGLRALAVVLVVAYHAGLPLMPGGYVGVDVFFVISGFLITGLLLAEHRKHGRISIPAFYARRARRLLPASALVLVTTMLVSHLVMPPLSADGVDSDAIAAALYVANWAFAAQTSDYFAAQVDASPLLHYWSLGVEEQFYVLWPLLIIGAVAIGTVLVRRGILLATRTRIALALVAVGGSSFLMSWQLTPVQPGWSYYGLHTRAWELAVGAGLAMAVPYLPRLTRGAAVGAGWAGLLLVLFAAVTFDEATPFPGTAALVPVLGTALVLAAGARERRGGAPRLLSERSVVSIGLTSYSWYLWHWPALVIARHLTAGPPTDDGSTPGAPWWAVVLAVAASYGLARLTTRYVENPVRTSPALAHDVPRSLALGAVLTALPVAVALMPLPGPVVTTSYAEVPGNGTVLVSGAECTDGSDDPCAPAEARLAAVPDVAPDVTPAQADADHVSGMGDCHRTFEPGGVASPCVWGDPAGATTIVLVGDSKAQHWLPALDAVGKKRGWKVYAWTRSSCPLADVNTTVEQAGGVYTACAAWRSQVEARVHELATGPGVDLVLVGRSRGYPGGMVDAQGVPVPTDDVTAVWRDGVASMVSEFGPVRRVALLRDLPWAPQEVPTCLSAHDGSSSACAFLATVDLRERQLAAAESEVAAASRGDVVTLQPAALVCPGDVCRAVTDDGTVVFRDRHHLTSTYSRSIASRFGDLVQSALPA